MAENNKLNIQCSPGTFSRVQNDPDYRDQLATNLLNSQPEAYNGLIFSPVLDEDGKQLAADLPNSSTETFKDLIFSSVQEDDGKQAWLVAPTKLLLSLLTELQPKVGKTANIKNKKKIWKVIAERMCLEGYNYSTTQIENKFRSLERKFKTTNLHNKKTGRDKQTCHYQSELELLLGEKRSINPDFVLDSEEAEGTTRSNSLNVASSETEYQDDGPSTSKKRKTKSDQATVLAAINDIATERKAYHKQMINFAQMREKRAQRKEEAPRKKLELLEKMVNQFQNASQ